MESIPEGDQKPLNYFKNKIERKEMATTRAI